MRRLALLLPLLGLVACAQHSPYYCQLTLGPDECPALDESTSDEGTATTTNSAGITTSGDSDAGATTSDSGGGASESVADADESGESETSESAGDTSEQARACRSIRRRPSRTSSATRRRPRRSGRSPALTERQRHRGGAARRRPGRRHRPRRGPVDLPGDERAAQQPGQRDHGPRAQRDRTDLRDVHLSAEHGQGPGHRDLDEARAERRRV
jgi:hypothetical protein